MQRCAASKSLANRRKERENDREYGISNLSPASFKFNYFNENGVFGRDQVRIVAELKSERDRLSQAIAALEGLSPRATAKRSAVPNPVTRRKKKRDRLTPEGRKRLSEMMKKRWAEKRKKGSKGR